MIDRDMILKALGAELATAVLHRDMLDANTLRIDIQLWDTETLDRTEEASLWERMIPCEVWLVPAETDESDE